MSRFDRYLLAQLLALFGLFSLILVAVFWVNRAVGLFDQLIGDGQSGLVFVEFSFLMLPNAIRLVLPVSAFAACVYAVNRMMNDSELVVMRALGLSPFRLSRAVVLFGLVVCAMQFALANLLVPLSQTRLAERTAEIGDDVVARFLSEGRFIHPAEGVTVFIRAISPTGELQGLFLDDARDPDESTTYTARKALIARADDAPRLVMIDGMAQTLSRDGSRRLAVTRFADFSLDLATVIGERAARARGLRELGTMALLRADAAVVAATSADRAALLEEGHSRIAGPLLGLVAPLIGFAALMLGGFSRTGLWRQMALAVLILIGLQMLATAASGVALRNEGGWPVLYAAPLAGAMTTLVLLALSQAPRRPARARAAGVAP